MKPKKAGIHAVDLHVGSRVRSRRIQIGMSQTDLGDALGITFQQIQKYEKGTNRISSSRLHQMARVLNVTPPYFFEEPLAGINDSHNASDASLFDNFCASRDGIMLMKAFLKIGRGTQRRIARLIEELASD